MVEIRTLINMYELGLIKKEDNEIMSSRFFINGDYSMELERIPSVAPTTEYITYTCIIRFLNSINIPVLELRFPSEDMYSFMDSVDGFTEFGMDSISIPIRVFNTSGKLTHLYLSRNYPSTPNENDKIRFEVREYNPMYGGVFSTRLGIDMDEEIFLNEFIQAIYFTFLIDIDERNMRGDYY